MTFPASHFGATTTRTWYKIQWNDQAAAELRGKFDLLDEERYEEHRDAARVIMTIKTPLCTAGTPLKMGSWSEERIDVWISENSR